METLKEINVISLLQENQSLASASPFHLIDDYIRKKEQRKN